MADLQTALDLVLALLLAATLFHALRLDRALRLLQRDRGALDALLATFDANTREAEAGIDRLRSLTEATSSQMDRQAELGGALKDDLAFLIERGDRLADRMDDLIRTARPIAAEPPCAEPPRLTTPEPAEPPAADPRRPAPDTPRMRSQAERDLLNALRATR